jgi:hypothetical protein
MFCNAERHERTQSQQFSRRGQQNIHGMDLYKPDPEEDSMMDVDPWLSVPETSGLDDPAEALFPSASPAPSFPGIAYRSRHMWLVCSYADQIIYLLVGMARLCDHASICSTCPARAAVVLAVARMCLH